MTADRKSKTPGSDRLLQTRTTRGAFLKYGAAGAASVAVGGAGLSSGLRRAGAETIPVVDPTTIKLEIRDGQVRMVDEVLVYMLGFVPAELVPSPEPFLRIPPFPGRKFPKDARKPFKLEGSKFEPAMDDVIVRSKVSQDSEAWASFFPERVIQIAQGQAITLTVTNRLKEPHRLVIDGIVDTGEIPGLDAAPDNSVTRTFAVSSPGTYIFHDPGPSQRPGAYRLLGLNGILVVTSASTGVDAWTVETNGLEFERQYVWHFHDVDPHWQKLAAMGAHPSTFPKFLPRYFTINGRSGVDAAGEGLDDAIRHDVKQDTKPHGVIRREQRLSDGRPGQLIRLANTGLTVHSPHIHGNHWVVRARNGALLSQIQEAAGGPTADIDFWMDKDVIRLDPLDRKDVILPFKPPPDASPLLDETTFTRANYPLCPDGSFEIHFPMHCHAEMSQTAAGGLYPNGALTDWVMLPAPA